MIFYLSPFLAGEHQVVDLERDRLQKDQAAEHVRLGSETELERRRDEVLERSGHGEYPDYRRRAGKSLINRVVNVSIRVLDLASC